MKVLVIGAGFAGCCAALLLRDSLGADDAPSRDGAREFRVYGRYLKTLRGGSLVPPPSG